MTGDCYLGKLPEVDGTAKTLKTMQVNIDQFKKALAQKDGQKGASSSGHGNSSRGGKNRGKNSFSNNNGSAADQQKMKMIC